MGQKWNKRARENDEVGTEFFSSENNYNAKKRDVYGISLMNEKNEVGEEKGCFKAVGVFDFPWLKDGVMFKSDECFFGFEFSSLEHYQDIFFKASGVDFLEEYGLCEIPEASMAHISPEAKLMEDLWQPFESFGLELEAEDVDCIWSFLLNKPL
ncbi:hypothetical protein RJT34_14369 [Clitoria ternatea]|uniref:Uncharacterized protein n=1 Tax=Clitoria ternatea TaxID=43366 RepID=A0AAN9JQL2_CLITE